MIFQRTLCNSFRYNLSRYSKQKPLIRLVSLNTSRSASSGPASQSLLQRYKYLIAGAAGLTVGSLVYVFSSDSKKKAPASVVAEDVFVPKTFTEDRLDEKLAILEKNGPIPYLLIGAGTASFSASRAIRSKDPTSRIVILGEEPFYPYMRPPLSKELWFGEAPPGDRLVFKQWNGKERSVYFELDDFYTPVESLFENKNGGVSVIRGVKVIRIDPTEQVVFLDNGKSLQYDKCLLATGAKPKNLPIFDDAGDDVKKHVSLFRGINDFHKLNHVLQKAKSVAIVGGGFLGSELACALGHKGSNGSLKVTQLFPEGGNMAKVLPDYLCKWTTEKVRSQGVQVMPKVHINKVSCEGKTLKLHLDSNETISADHVIVAVGVDAQTELAEKSGLEVDEKHGGYLVNTELEARKNLWIAGDASCFYDTKLGRRRVEHHDHAVVSGRLAGENMTGKGKPYWHQSMFWSDLGPEIAYEGIGLVDSSLQTVGVFSKSSPEKAEKASERSEPGSASESVKQDTNKKDIEFENKEPRAPLPGDEYNKGILFYMKKNTIVGIVLWNVFGKMNIARKIINEAKPYDDLAEVAKLFDLKSEPSE